MAAAAPRPLSGVGWAAGPEAVPPGWTAVTVTAEGAPAAVGRGFGHRGGGWFLCVRPAPEQPGACPLVTDVLVLSERVPQPPGYSRAPEFPEPRSGVSRRKRLLVKLEEPKEAIPAVLELQLSAKGRILPLFTKVGEMGGFAIWCRKGPVKPRPDPDPDPSPLSEALEQLGLRPPRPPPLPSRRSHPESPPDPSGIYGLSAMDGIPFVLHPKFEPKLSPPVLAELTVKSLADIEQEYNYGFLVERTAAARLPPGT